MTEAQRYPDVQGDVQGYAKAVETVRALIVRRDRYVYPAGAAAFTPAYRAVAVDELERALSLIQPRTVDLDVDFPSSHDSTHDHVTVTLEYGGIKHESTIMLNTPLPPELVAHAVTRAAEKIAESIDPTRPTR